MKIIKDIYSIPCAKYCGGKKAIRIVETATSKKAYVQFADGMQIWKHDPNHNYWKLIQEVHACNC